MTLLLVSTADTDLLAAKASEAGWRTANPARTGVERDHDRGRADVDPLGWFGFADRVAERE